MAILDPSFQPTCRVIDAEAGLGILRYRRIRTEWAGDDNQEEQCSSLLNSFRNRVPPTNPVNENWQCWRGGTLPNGSTHWIADITIGAWRLPLETEDVKLEIVNSLREHFQRFDIDVDKLLL